MSGSLDADSQLANLKPSYQLVATSNNLTVFPVPLLAAIDAARLQNLHAELINQSEEKVDPGPRPSRERLILLARYLSTNHRQQCGGGSAEGYDAFLSDRDDRVAGGQANRNQYHCQGEKESAVTH